jgi:hypothetical protein
MEWMLQVADEVDDVVAVVRLFTLALAAEFMPAGGGGRIAMPFHAARHSPADPPAP